jgi:predicted metal-dependent hydrolase
MSTEHREIRVRGISIQIVRKPIKHLHLGVYPPAGRVRVAAPMAVSDDAVRLAVIGRLGWIKKQRARFDAQPRQSRREMIGGESHYYYLDAAIVFESPNERVQRLSNIAATRSSSLHLLH